MVKDSTEVIFHLHGKLGLDIHDTKVKAGFDYGGECLKICMIIMANDHIGIVTKYGTTAKTIKKMKVNSVKKVVILAAADVKEEYENVKIMFNIANLNSIKMFLSIDLKMANIVLGLQSHSASHPCHICDAKNPKKPGVDWEEGNLRTLGSIRDNVEKYRNSTDPKRAQVTE